MKWQPIETAPKDGTEILLLIPLDWQSSTIIEPRIGKGRYVATGWFTCEGWLNRLGQWVNEETPTHWMPLPEPPKGKE